MEPARLADSVITAALPGYRTATPSRPELRGMVVEILTTLVSEFEGRFADENTTIWAAFPSLLPASNTFLDPDDLKPLLEYTFSIPYFKDCGTDEDLFQQFKAECQTFRMPLRKEFANHEADTVLNAMVSKSENNHVGKVLWAVM